MAVSALELRPRGAVALMDAALRVCVRSTGVWALTLPGGVLVTAALMHLTDTVVQRRPLALPVLLFTLAWLARGLFQGAACHHVHQLLLAPGGEPTGAWDSLRAALARAPSLLRAVGYVLLFNVLTLGLTLGLAYIFLSAHLVGYAVAVQGQGGAGGLYGRCARLLGPARLTATGVRLLLLVQGLVLVNLHLGASALFYVGRKLLGIDLTFADRFASLDNPTWMLFLLAVTFTLFEPLRAATATLLLLEGRVRQEGLDLLAAVRQLPGRKGATALLVLLGLALGPTPARAARAGEHSVSPEDLRSRVESLARACETERKTLDGWRETLGAVGPQEARKVERLVRAVEASVHEDEDCGAMDRLDAGLTLAASTARLERQRADSEAARARARAILARPEFQEPAPAASQEDKPPDDSVPNGLWERFTRWLAKLLEALFRNRTAPTPPRPDASFGGQEVAHLLVVLLVTAALAVLGGVLWRAFQARRQDAGADRLEVSSQSAASLAEDPMNALARPPEGWAHLADELAARGEYREAVRGLYLALLSRLHQEGAIHYDAHASNWDYLRQFRGRGEWKPSLRELTLRFDFAWYGNLPVGASGYRDFRALCAPMLSSPALAEPPRA